MTRRGGPSSDAVVLHLAAECAGWARVGGLGEAVEGLARAQARAGLGAAVAIPLYPSVRAAELGLVAGPWYSVPLGGHEVPARIHRGTVGGGVDLFAVEMASFDRPGIYGEAGWSYPDNDLRFGGFVLAVIEALSRIMPRLEVVHAHDWHTGLTPVLVRQRATRGRSIATVLSVHNAAHQGRFGVGSLDALGVPESSVAGITPDHDQRYSWLEIGLRAAECVATVSATHAAELRTPLGGFGLDHIFARLGDRLVGIPNGIDPERWDPESDPTLPAPFSVADLSGRRRCRRELLADYQLAGDGCVPILGVVARLVQQKGLDLILDGFIDRFPTARLIVLGRGDPSYESRLAELAARHPDRVRVPLTFTESAERRLLAGADLCLMPSLFEPCGLVQMHAQRYGAIPVARRVGGLAETIVDGVTGFLFDPFTPDALAESVAAGLAVVASPARRDAMIRAGMALDFGWAGSANAYRILYRKACERRGLVEPLAHPPRSARRLPSRRRTAPGHHVCLAPGGARGGTDRDGG